MDFERLKDIAIEAALSAGAIIRDSINHNVEVETKNVGSQLASQVVTEFKSLVSKSGGLAR